MWFIALRSKLNKVFKMSASSLQYGLLVEFFPTTMWKEFTKNQLKKDKKEQTGTEVFITRIDMSKKKRGHIRVYHGDHKQFDDDIITNIK